MGLGALAVRHDVTSAALVRHSIADDLTHRSIGEDDIADVVLVASELFGNAVVHTCSGEADLDIEWDVQPESVTVRVDDSSESLPEQRDTDPADTNGRGLAIVAAIASDWGVHRWRRGKQVWARVPIERR
jgi:anti-sigma regulatory factor (Ser/Thr protein kinase)